MESVALTREVTFSSGHRFWLDHLSAAENLTLFGAYASRFNHGHNYRLQVTIDGQVDPMTGMVVNIKLLDELLQDNVVDKFHLKSLNDEVAVLKGKVPTLEVLLHVVRNLIAEPDGRVLLNSSSPQNCQVTLQRLRCFEMPDLWADWTENMMTLTRSYEFAAAHRLHVAGLSHDENVKLFGKCNNQNGHGHNYVVEVTVTGQMDENTGMIIDLVQLDRLVESEIVEKLDHKNLDVDVPELLGRPTTSENIVAFIDKVLQEKLGKALVGVRLFETARNSFEISHG